MDKMEFKKITMEVLTNYGFIKKKSIYVLNFLNFIIKLSLYHSQYDKRYYIEYTFFFKALHSENELNELKYNGDFVTCNRILFSGLDFYNYEDNDKEKYTYDLNVSLKNQIDPIKSGGIKYIKTFSDLVPTNEAKEFLEKF